MLNIFIYIYYIYTEYTSYIQYNYVGVLAGSQCRSFYEQSESAAPHFPCFGVAIVDWQIRQTHFEYDIVKKKSPPSIPDGSVKFLVSYLVQLPH